MKKFMLLSFAMLAFGAAGLFAQTSAWGEDYKSALAEAKKTDKHILMNFSGSDWCKWCKKLDAEVFRQDAFKKYALIDTPSQKPMAEAVVKQNDALKEKYRIEGFPTVLLLNPAGEVIATTGYQFGGAEKYVEHLKELIANSKKI
jgi:thioredoxin-related protein